MPTRTATTSSDLPLTSGLESFALDCGSLPTAVNISCFRGAGGVAEYHLLVRPTQYGSMETQLNWVACAYSNALAALGLNLRTAVWRRFFCTDPVNQAGALQAHPLANPAAVGDPCAVSWVGQACVPPAKVALWAYHIQDPRGELDKAHDGTSLTLRRGELSHLWTTNLTSPHGGTSHEQTRAIFENYNAALESRGLSLAQHALRTWLFVRDIDANYQGMVTARREYFAAHGLTPETHYIASSGIEGVSTRLEAGVSMDAYAIGGVRPEQVQHLAALDHLCPTQAYGVTFERGTAIAYRDRKHVLISGTASIDPQGNIMHPGEIWRQLDRTMENIEALLQQAGAALRDVGLLIVYIRDPSDYAPARHQMRERLGDVPIVIVGAPVCRPGWLIEVEAMAIVPADHPGLPEF